MQEKTRFDKIYEVAVKYFENNHWFNTGELLSKQGFVSYVETKGRTLNIICKIDGFLNRIIFEMEPQIHVTDPFRGQVSEYISLINEYTGKTFMGVRANGTVYIHAECDCSVKIPSEKSFALLERRCTTELLTFAGILQKLANGRLLSLEEADIEQVRASQLSLIHKLISEEAVPHNKEGADAE